MAKAKGSAGRVIRPGHLSEIVSLDGLQNDPAFFDRTTERAYVFNSDGTLNMTASQHIAHSVDIPPEIAWTLGNKILIHNHPIPVLATNLNFGLSMGDVYLTAKYNLSEIRATNIIGTHILRRGKNGWPSMDKVENAINSSRNDYGSVGDGTWARDFARKTGGTYAFIPR